MGFGIGVLVTLVPLYQSEVSPPESRGLMVGLHGGQYVPSVLLYFVLISLVLIGLSYSMTGFVTYGKRRPCSIRLTMVPDVTRRLLLCSLWTVPMAVPIGCPAHSNHDSVNRIVLASVLSSMAVISRPI